MSLGTLGLDPGQGHWAAEFWDRACWRVAPGEPLRLPGIPAHGARLVALRLGLGRLIFDTTRNRGIMANLGIAPELTAQAARSLNSRAAWPIMAA